MNDADIRDTPSLYPALLAKSVEIGFTMPADRYLGPLLKTLVASKPGGRFLELGTGSGLSLAWMRDGLSRGGTVISVENDPDLCANAAEFFGHDGRVTIVEADAARWLENYSGPAFDLVFADTWPGKYGQLEEALSILQPGGMYVIDDMSPRPDWPAGHAQRAETLVATLEARQDLTLTKMAWSTGVILAVKVGEP